MDDSDIPALARQVKAVIKQANKAGEIAGQTFTLRIAKERVAEALGIDADVLSEPKWKKMVKGLIQDAMEAIDGPESEPKSSAPPKKAASKPKAKPVDKESGTDSAKPKKGKERVIQSDEEQPESRASQDDGDVAAKSESDMSIVNDPSPKPKRRAKRKSGERPDSDDGGAGAVKKQKQKKGKKVSSGRGGGSGSPDDGIVDVDSDDSAPPKQKEKAKNARASGSGTQAPPSSDRVQELKGIVNACGIRKQWAKELADMSDQRQISHLKSILSGLGMSGEPNKAKAKRIKEARALAAELEDVQEFAAVRGAADPAATGRPRRSAAVPKQSYALSTKVDSDDDDDDADSNTGGKRKRKRRSRSAGTTEDDDDDSEVDDDEGAEESEEEQEYEMTPAKAKKGRKAKRVSELSDSEVGSD